MKIIKCLLSIATLILAAACTKDGGGRAVNVSVSPSELSAPYLLSSQNFEVQADGAWTARILSDAGESVSWATLSREKGNGNAKVTVRVFDNEYKNARVAKITITSASGNEAVVTLTQAGNPKSDTEVVEATVRVGTFNVRVAGKNETDPNNNWENRKPRVIKSIQGNNFDFFGLNEVSKDIAEYLTEELKNTYAIEFFNPYQGLSTKYAAQGIAYRKDRYTLSEWNVFYLSDTPDRPTFNDGGSYCRAACCGVLTHKMSGIKIFMMVTHGALDNDSRDSFAHLCAEMEKKYNPKGYPSFFVGDMNADPSCKATEIYRRHWMDAYLDAPERTGSIATYNGFNLSVDLNNPSKRIDYVYYRNAVPLTYACDNTKFDGLFPSDHFPVYSDMKVLLTAE
jgi:endonuclease/exonuclease/phosphatase family metal-dependent hydrolase